MNLNSNSHSTQIQIQTQTHTRHVIHVVKPRTLNRPSDSPLYLDQWTTGENIETWVHIKLTFTIQFLILRICRTPPFVLRSFVNKQTLAHAVTWRRSGAKSILEPVTTRNYDASRSFRATFSDDSFWVQQVTMIHPMYYIVQTSKAGKWCIILNDNFFYLLFKHRKGAVVTHMIHEIIIDFHPSVSLALDLWLERANGGRNCFLCLVSCSWKVSFVIKKSAKSSANPDDGIYIKILKQNICIVWEYSVRLVIGISAWYDHIYPLR